jgi:hypothetical protein
MNRRHITRVTLDDGSVIAELWIFTPDACPQCAAAGLRVNPAGNYRVCVSCRRGWELERQPHAAAENPALGQVVAALAQAGRA